MSERYQIYQLERQNIIDKVEEDGVLRKDWYDHPELGKCLLKEARSPDWNITDNRDIRTDWSEKVVYEIAKLINVPAARYELASGYFDDSTEPNESIVSINCIPPSNTGVVTGEELLIRNINGYRSDNPSQYTVENVLGALELSEVKPPSNWQQPIPEIDTGAKLFVGYLMMDAMVINRDRHYRNWSIMVVGERIELIPSYDHGLSLGSTDKINLSPERYAERSKSPFQGNNQQLATFSAFERAARLYPAAASIWQKRLELVTFTQITEIFNRIPQERITPIAAKFAIDLLAYNRQRIVDLEIELDSQYIRKYDR